MQTTKSAAAKHHIGPIKTQIWNKAYVIARLSNEIIVSNEINGFVKPIQCYIFVLKDRGPFYLSLKLCQVRSYRTRSHYLKNVAD